MKNMNVKKNDTVVVITGKDAGKSGKVLEVNAKTNRVVVEGVNIVSRHTKARKAQEKSQIVKKEAGIDVSNVMILCPKCGKATRVKHTVVDGKNVRACKCGEILDKKFVKESDKKVAKAEKPATKKAEKVENKEVAEKKETVKKVKATATSSKATKLTTGKKSQRGV